MFLFAGMVVGACCLGEKAEKNRQGTFVVCSGLVLLSSPAPEYANPGQAEPRAGCAVMDDIPSHSILSIHYLYFSGRGCG